MTYLQELINKGLEIKRREKEEKERDKIEANTTALNIVDKLQQILVEQEVKGSVKIYQPAHPLTTTDDVIHLQIVLHDYQDWSIYLKSRAM